MINIKLNLRIKSDLFISNEIFEAKIRTTVYGWSTY